MPIILRYVVECQPSSHKVPEIGQWFEQANEQDTDNMQMNRITTSFYYGTEPGKEAMCTKICEKQKIQYSIRHIYTGSYVELQSTFRQIPGS